MVLRRTLAIGLSLFVSLGCEAQTPGVWLGELSWPEAQKRLISSLLYHFQSYLILK